MGPRDNGHNGSFSEVPHSMHQPLFLSGKTPYKPEEFSHQHNGHNGSRIVPSHTPQISSAESQRIQFQAFSDGTLVDLVRDVVAPEEFKLMIWKDGHGTIGRRFYHREKLIVPLQVEPSVRKAVRMPSGIEPCGKPRELLHDLENCISKYVEISNNFVRLTTHFVLATWFHDCFPVAPYLWLTGPFGSGKTTLLRLLHAMCRRGILVGDVTVASLYSLPSTILPTLLIDEFESGRGQRDRDLLRLLRTGSVQGCNAVRGSKVYSPFCAKVVSSRQIPQDAALASRAIFIPMRPTSRSLPLLDEGTLDTIASQFQPRLLNFRLRNFNTALRNLRSKVSSFTPRMQDLSRILVAPLFGDKDLADRLFEILRQQDDEAKLNRYGEPEWVVATALFYDCHRTTGLHTVGSLCETVHRVLAENGEVYSVTPRGIGNILRTLGLRTHKLGNQGRGLRLTQNVAREIHQLACDMGLKRSDILQQTTVDAGYGGPPCALCEEYGLMIREDGKPLRCISLPPPRRSGGPYEK